MKMNYKDGSWEQAIGKLISDIRHEEPLYTINDDPRSLWTKSEGMRNMLWVQQFAHYCINQLAMIGAWDDPYADLAYVEFYAGKQRDYGPENINRFGFKGIEIRMWDKVARLENLNSKHREPKFESVVDTYDDMLGYCLIALMLMDGTFMLPLESEL